MATKPNDDSSLSHTKLVLGAFGCDDQVCPNEVSRLFKDVLEEKEFKNTFKYITFAIDEGKESSRKVVGKEGNYRSFYDTFGV